MAFHNVLGDVFEVIVFAHRVFSADLRHRSLPLEVIVNIVERENFAVYFFHVIVNRRFRSVEFNHRLGKMSKSVVADRRPVTEPTYLFSAVSEEGVRLK